MSDEPKRMSLTSNVQALSLANYDFSYSLYKVLSKADGNIFYSPLSIHVLMFMASIGAVSNTFDEILATIHLNKSNDLLEAYKELLNNLMTNDNENLKLATGMFIDSNYKVKQSYIDTTSNYLKSSLDKLNFKENPEEQRKHINDWVSNKTNGKINNLFPPGSLSQDTALVLANALHFKSSWAHPFKDVADEPFYLSPNNSVTVKMMNLIEELNYFHDANLKYAALELPYDYNLFKMVILLPDAKDGLKDLELNLSKIKLPDILDNMTKYKVQVKLPRFRLEQSIDLSEILSTLGCPTMFTNQANFSNIYEPSEIPLSVSKVLHKAYIDVNEAGTEAAAATGMALLTRCLKISNDYEEVDFFAVHPFIFLIMGVNGELIFFGRLQHLSED